jgi:hypothetical protein
VCDDPSAEDLMIFDVFLHEHIDRPKIFKTPQNRVQLGVLVVSNSFNYATDRLERSATAVEQQ